MTTSLKQYLFVVMSCGLLASSNVWSESSSDCALIESARERLACFDRQFPRPDGVPRSSNPPIQERSTLTAPTPGLGISTSADSESSTDNRFAPQRPWQEPEKGKGLFAWMDQLDIDTEIAALRSGNQQRMVFRLANGQIWMQSSPRELPFSIGDKVNIKNARMGGYILRSESGTSTRVQRIE